MSTRNAIKSVYILLGTEQPLPGDGWLDEDGNAITTEDDEIITLD